MQVSIVSCNLFFSLCEDDSEIVNTKKFKEVLLNSGLKANDKRLYNLFQNLDAHGDKIVFEEEVADNFETVAKVSKVKGPGIGTISVTSTQLNNIEFYPSEERRRFVGVHTTPLNLQNGEKVFISGMSTTSSQLQQRTYTIGISSTKLIDFFNLSLKLPEINLKGL